ncbi:MAG TPA: response regulator [Xanthobacteraceae bacterium]|nr:response regulator [Xanthobacteraceae bacterium]
MGSLGINEITHLDDVRDGKDRNREGSLRRVLVVEDEPLICVDTADALERQGFKVDTALSGEEALRLLRNGLPIDILFTDMNLAGHMDGATLGRLARDLLPGLVVVYTSGSMNAVPQGVPGSAFVPKPYSPDLVGVMLSRMARIHA